MPSAIPSTSRPHCGWLSLLVFLACSTVMSGVEGGIFADRFELQPILPASEFLVSAWSTLEAECPTANPGPTEGYPGAFVLLCYRLENVGTATLKGVRVVDPGFGTMAELVIDLPPGEALVFADAAGHRELLAPLAGFPGFTVTDGLRIGFRQTSHQVPMSPHLTLYRLLAVSEADCSAGLAGPFPPPSTSGYRLRTVSPGTPVVHCLTMHNSSTTGGTVGLPSLREHSISDSELGLLADNESFELSAFPHAYWTFRHTAPAPAADSEFLSTWTTEADWFHDDPPGTVQISTFQTATLRVVADPACDGIIEHTSLAYDAVLGIPVSSGIRLDFEVDAAPATAGQSSQITASGFISNLQPAQAFGPRDDTRILLPIPAGIDTDSLTVSGTITGGSALAVEIDPTAGLITLSTGPVPGVPAEVSLSIEARPDGTENPVIWPAPALNMVVIGDEGEESTLVLQPEAGAPPVLIQPLCTT